ncbi:hypothetical protein [Kribbella sp. NPDC048928]|uniref:hypothetical protein n=1 Tax=Kribbella sp. NPDC048928 TaxID=3364111 RepID=UPI0037225B93
MTVLLAAGSPPAVRWCAQTLSIGHRDVLQRSTADLCRQWRDSYEALHRAKTGRQRLRIVLERQLCLDELGRRDPEGLEAWLTSAASDPSRFLKTR